LHQADLRDAEERIRDTRSICDVCLAPVPASLRRDGDAVHLVKQCPEHGERRWLVSRNGDDYVAFDRHYHRLFPRAEAAVPTGEPIFCLTNRCNQNCHYCLTSASRERQFDDFDLDAFARILRSDRSTKVLLFGGEPFMHPRFDDFVAAVARTGKTAVVCTNGMALADPDVVARLVRMTGGRLFVRMTFEGFDDADYAHLHVPGLRQRKLAALANLEAHAVPTFLAHTVTVDELRDPARLRRCLDALIAYAKDGHGVRGVGFSCLTALGGERELSGEWVLSVDRMIDHLVDSPLVPVARRHVYTAEHLIHWFYHLAGDPVCEYKQTIVLLRHGGAWVGLDAFVDCDALRRRLDARLAKGAPSRWRRALGLAFDLARSLRPRQAHHLVGMGLRVLPFLWHGRDYRRLPEILLVLTAGTACDPNNYDETVARSCEKPFHTFEDGCARVASSSRFLIRKLRRPGDGDGTTGG
jgi:hypothetical protein